jgi:hypothetical protein
MEKTNQLQQEEENKMKIRTLIIGLLILSILLIAGCQKAVDTTPEELDIGTLDDATPELEGEDTELPEMDDLTPESQEETDVDFGDVV